MTARSPVITRCTLEIDEEGPQRPIVRVTYHIPEHCAGGRRPAGPCATPMHASDPAARWLAGVAHLEAISVHAFIELARELRFHNAPATFSYRALLAAADEVDHAAAVAALAREGGTALEVPRVSRPPTRTLFELAKTNAVEGCVRELYGALVAGWQSDHTASRQMRSVFAAIAADEIRHAELAFDIHRWAIAQLSHDQRLEIAAAQRLACEAIEADVSSDLDVLAALGLPEPKNARELARVVARVAAPLFAT